MIRVTLKDVAKLAGVNFTLVSKYLNDSSQARMKPETRERIKRAIESLKYRPSASARALRSGRSRIIGMVSGDLRNAYWAHFASCAMRYLRGQDYQLLLAVRDSDASPEPLEFLVDRGVDGIIISGADLPPGYVAPCPMVVHDTASCGGDVVNPDMVPALEEALAGVRGRITALLPPNSAWRAIFADAAERNGLTSELCTVPLAPEKRPEVLRRICRFAPDWMLVSGWHTLTQLLELLHGEFTGFHPKIIAHANCRGEFLNAPEIACAIVSSTTTLVREVCSLLLDRIAAPGVSAVRKLPCRCIVSGCAEFRTLYAPHFELT